MSERALLPPYRGTAETALADAVAAQFPIETPARDLWNPERCPAHLLGWLAWALSVDDWDMDWPEDVKRRVIAESVVAHRQKGTVGAVRRALAALGVDVEIREWFETAEPPHTFHLDAWADDVFAAGFNVDNRFYDLVRRQVDHVKPARAHFTLRLGDRFRTEGYLRTSVRPAQLHQADIDPGPRPAMVAGGPMLRTGLRTRRVFSQDHEPQPRPAIAPVGAGVRLSARARAISKQFHEVERRAAL